MALAVPLRLLRLLCIAQLLAIGARFASGAVLQNPRPTNVTYDHRSLMLNGERILWVSGA